MKKNCENPLLRFWPYPMGKLWFVLLTRAKAVVYESFIMLYNVLTDVRERSLQREK